MTIAMQKDYYKVGHPFQYPPGTNLVYSNFTARSAKHAEKKLAGRFNGKVVVFAIQGFILDILINTWNRDFFDRPKEEVVKEYKRIMDYTLGVDTVSTNHLAELHDLGFLPLRIKALPEGSLVNMKVPFMTITNTRARFYWVTNMIETMASAYIWPAITAATIGYEYRRQTNEWALTTGSNLDFTAWQNHDFSMRGLLGLGGSIPSIGAGHLLSSYGTDTIPSIIYLEKFYGADVEKEIVGGSVPATEHSVMCAGGKGDERETYRRIIQDIYPTGVVSIVSDTWDFWHVLDVIAPSLKDVILSRGPNAIGLSKVVFRPDSGDPVEVLCGLEIEDYTEGCKGLDEAREYAEDYAVSKVCSETPHGKQGESEVVAVFKYEGKVYQTTVSIEWNHHGKRFYYVDGHSSTEPVEIELTPEQMGAVEVLYNHFGGDLNEKGYIEVCNRVGLIYGDSISLEIQGEIYRRLAKKGFSSGNVVFGVGSYTYQYVTRDTFGMAMKATYAEKDGVGEELFKDPITDIGSVKKSAKGLIRVEKEGDDFVLYDQQTWEQENGGALETVFEDGNLLKRQTLAEIRERLGAFKF